MPHQTIDLLERQDAFVRRSVSDGRYRDADDVVNAALLLLAQKQQEDEFKLQHLRRLAAEAAAEVDRGEFIMIDSDQSLDRFMDEVSEKSRAVAK